jgi:hypothetical protein
MPSVKVAIRTRPEEYESLLDSFDTAGSHGGINLKEHKFTFDKVFAANATQEEVFNSCAVGICNDVLEGFNGTIFAYGQTGAGKTHTMSGPVDMANYEEDRGLCMRTAAYLFGRARKMSDTISIRLSVLEIYNEQLYDLLHEKPGESKYDKYDL